MIGRLSIAVPASALLILTLYDFTQGVARHTLYLRLMMAAAALCCLLIPSAMRNLMAVCVYSVLTGGLAADVLIYKTTLSPVNTRLALHAKIWNTNGITYDARTPLEVVRQLRKEGHKAFPKINPITLATPTEDGVLRSIIRIDDNEVLPVSTLSSTFIVWCNETGTYVHYTSDRFGFHNPDSVWNGPVEIALVGDSFGEGECVRDDENIAARLRRLVAGTVNLSMGANGPLMQLAALSELPSGMEPRSIIWLYFEGNDLIDLYSEWSSPLLRRYLSPSFSQNLFKMKERIDAVLVDFIERTLRDPSKTLGANTGDRKKNSALDFLLMRHLRDRLAQLGAIHKVAPIEQLATVLRIAGQRAQAWRGTIFFVYLPDAARFRNAGELPSPLFQREEVLQTVQDLQIPVLDLTSAFAREAKPLSLYALDGHGHLTKAGYQKAGDEIAAFLLRRGVLRYADSPRSP